jgi:hypothetical protein
VHNKADLLPTGALAAIPPADRPAGMLASAKSGWNVPVLLDAIVRCLVPDAPPTGAAVPFTVGQTEAIRSAIDDAERGDGEQAAAVLARLVATGSGE